MKSDACFFVLRKFLIFASEIDFMKHFVKSKRKYIFIAAASAAVAAALFSSCRQSENKTAGADDEVVESTVKDPGESYLKVNGDREGVITRPSGLQAEVIKRTEGARPTANSTVTIAYEGRLVNGTVFDKSDDASFPVNAVIPGFAEGLQLMTLGSTWRLYIPSELGYGQRGVPGVIPPNAVLIFDITLNKIE